MCPLGVPTSPPSRPASAGPRPGPVGVLGRTPRPSQTGNLSPVVTGRYGQSLRLLGVPSLPAGRSTAQFPQSPRAYPASCAAPAVLEARPLFRAAPARI